MAYQKQTWENAPSTNSPLSADRLNHMEDGIDNAYKQIKNSYNTSTADSYSCNYMNTILDNQATLYENSTGTNGNITLSDSADNYSYLMVYWKSIWNSSRNGVVLAPTKTDNWSLFEQVVESGSGTTIYKNIAIYSINGTAFNYIKASNYNNQNSNTFYITKIVGYK